MKKLLAIIFSVFFIAMLSACGGDKNMGGNSNGNDNGGSAMESGMTNTASDEAKLTADEALDIALSDAGLKKADVSMIENHLDYDNGVLVYEIDFDSEAHEYSYEINAKTGVIVDRDKDMKD